MRRKGRRYRSRLQKVSESAWRPAGCAPSDCVFRFPRDASSRRRGTAQPGTLAIALRSALADPQKYGYLPTPIPQYPFFAELKSYAGAALDLYHVQTQLLISRCLTDISFHKTEFMLGLEFSQSRSRLRHELALYPTAHATSRPPSNGARRREYGTAAAGMRGSERGRQKNLGKR